MNTKVVNLSEIDPIDFFNQQDLLLGDKNGRWCVVQDDIIFAQFISKQDAEALLDTYNSPTTSELENLTTEEFLDRVNITIEQAEELLRKLKR